LQTASVVAVVVFFAEYVSDLGLAHGGHQSFYLFGTHLHSMHCIHGNHQAKKDIANMAQQKTPPLLSRNQVQAGARVRDFLTRKEELENYRG